MPEWRWWNKLLSSVRCPPRPWVCVLSIAQLLHEYKNGASPLHCVPTYGTLWDFSEMLHSRKVSQFAPKEPEGNKGYPLVFSHGVWGLGLYKLCPFLPLQQPEMEGVASYISFLHCQIGEISMCCNLADSTDRGWYGSCPLLSKVLVSVRKGKNCVRYFLLFVIVGICKRWGNFEVLIAITFPHKAKMKDVDLPQTQGDDYQMEKGGMESA